MMMTMDDDWWSTTSNLITDDCLLSEVTSIRSCNNYYCDLTTGGGGPNSAVRGQTMEFGNTMTPSPNRPSIENGDQFTLLDSSTSGDSSVKCEPADEHFCFVTQSDSPSTSQSSLSSYENELGKHGNLPESVHFDDSSSIASSECSSPLGTCGGQFYGKDSIEPTKTRSKMHEMAVKKKLITDQDLRGTGLLQLSVEEKRTLMQEGFSMPSRLPLSKAEEEALKIVRRKIKNKLSAQESRRKRKEYMDALEQKVERFFSENSNLKLKVKNLERSNRSLLVQLKKLQAQIHAQTANQ